MPETLLGQTLAGVPGEWGTIPDHTDTITTKTYSVHRKPTLSYSVRKKHALQRLVAYALPMLSNVEEHSFLFAHTVYVLNTSAGRVQLHADGGSGEQQDSVHARWTVAAAEGLGSAATDQASDRPAESVAADGPALVGPRQGHVRLVRTDWQHIVCD